MTEQHPTDDLDFPTPTRTPEQIAAQEALEARVNEFLSTIHTESDAIHVHMMLSRQFGFFSTAVSRSDVSLLLWERGIGDQDINEKLTNMILDDDQMHKDVEYRLTDISNEIVGEYVLNYAEAVIDNEPVLVVRTDAGDVEVLGEEDFTDAESLALATMREVKHSTDDNRFTIQDMIDMVEADEEEVELVNPDEVPLTAPVVSVSAKITVSGVDKFIPFD